MKTKLLGYIGTGILLVAVSASAKDGELVLSAKDAGSLSVANAVDPSHSSWTGVSEFRIHLNRTPPLFVGGSLDDGVRPVTNVRLQRMSDGSVAFRFDWTDATQDLVQTNLRYPKKDKDLVAIKHSEGIETFADGVCVMVPQKRGSHTAYPSLIMGEKNRPVDLYCWRAGFGPRKMTAKGRETVEMTKDKFSGSMERTSTGWTAVLIVPDLQTNTPVAFAIWDGSKEHRDGIKYFSIWYEVE